MDEQSTSWDAFLEALKDFREASSSLEVMTDGTLRDRAVEVIVAAYFQMEDPDHQGEAAEIFLMAYLEHHERRDLIRDYGRELPCSSI